MNTPNRPTDDMPTLADPEVQRCPFGAYDRMRSRGSVFFDSPTQMYVVTSYATIRAVAGDPRTFSSANKRPVSANRDTSHSAQIDRLWREADFVPVDTLVSCDPPIHRRHRSLVDKAFRPDRIEAAEPRIQEIVHELIDAFPPGSFDFLPRFAIPLPMRMISELLGVPAAMAATFKLWSDAVLEAVNLNISGEREIETVKIKIDMYRYFWGRVEALRERPEETLLSDLANAKPDGEFLGRSELTGLLRNILVAGNETTTTALAWCAHTLTKKPDVQRELRADPTRIPNFTEEVLRLDAPVQGLFRRATRDVTLGGVDIPEGAILDLRWAAGNRDDAQFPSPDEMNLHRPNQAQHLTFGFGIHFCLGNRLARAELAHAVRLLLARSRNISLVPGESSLEQVTHYFARGVSRLMIDFDPA